VGEVAMPINDIPIDAIYPGEPYSRLASLKPYLLDEFRQVGWDHRVEWKPRVKGDDEELYYALVTVNGRELIAIREIDLPVTPTDTIIGDLRAALS